MLLMGQMITKKGDKHIKFFYEDQSMMGMTNTNTATLSKLVGL